MNVRTENHLKRAAEFDAKARHAAEAATRRVFQEMALTYRQLAVSSATPRLNLFAAE
jgi:hypothetical protein